MLHCDNKHNDSSESVIAQHYLVNVHYIFTPFLKKVLSFVVVVIYVHITCSLQQGQGPSLDGDQMELLQSNKKQNTKRRTKQERLKDFVKHNMKRIKHLIGSYSRQSSAYCVAELALVDKACQV